MNRKKILLAVSAVALIALAGCGGGGPSGEKLGQDTGQDISNVSLGESYMYEVKITEKNQYGLVQKRPPFIMEDSLERQNLIKRYEYLNDKNNVHHVYMMSNDGKVINYEVAQGKVSSVNSKLTNDLQPVRIPGCDAHKSGNDCWKVVESPQMDGSYGKNGDAIFFFTTDGHYVEWNGLYVVSEEPKNIQTQVSLVDIDDSSNSDDSSEETTNETANNSTS
ncbi:hypothetical protein C499_14070 [Halogeometricum borinquense DSM 11551]|uniref:Lipoprotein n=1 Tax=Halogeometricum borinquense (strain ATCC 700274 / DSM 11551 / JCM 10706 / KCTC 4070 / PR3) TaxID=469382 RepID=E4NTZ4_HALBP|nr:hypothetical protein [Halogeometricum borinquense]ADQ68514.1 hypothetical protein Hbor_29750 [Halogeometricum borinquense DSM 11551]ELY25615.1 hypothetical protein C499_14070 [Halogeometricum borinquense DSM 11551]